MSWETSIYRPTLNLQEWCVTQQDDFQKVWLVLGLSKGASQGLARSSLESKSTKEVSQTDYLSHETMSCFTCFCLPVRLFRSRRQRIRSAFCWSPWRSACCCRLQDLSKAQARRGSPAPGHPGREGRSAGLLRAAFFPFFFKHNSGSVVQSFKARLVQSTTSQLCPCISCRPGKTPASLPPDPAVTLPTRPRCTQRSRLHGRIRPHGVPWIQAGAGPPWSSLEGMNSSERVGMSEDT